MLAAPPYPVRTFLLPGLASLLVAVACGGQTTGPAGSSSSGGGTSSSGSSGGAGSSGAGSSGGASSSSSSGAGFGCGDFTTTPSPVDPTLCQPQLQSATSCNGQVCSYTVELPCVGDAGSGFDGVDAGLDQCTAWCNAAAPPGMQPGIGFCQVESIDGGAPAIVARCGGCGI